MTHPLRDLPIAQLKKIILKPFIFNDLRITVINALWFLHPAGWNIPDHVHHCYEFSYVDSGYYFTEIENNEYKTRGGQAHLIPPQMIHNHRKEDINPDYGYCIRFVLEQLKDNEETSVFSLYDSLVYHLDKMKDQSFEFEGEKHLEKLFHTGQIGIQFGIIEFLLAVCGCSEEQICIDNSAGNSKTDNKSSKDAMLVEQVIFYLNNYKGSSFNAEKMAESFYISYRQLSRVFKKITGSSVLKYYNQIRIERAKKMLEESGLSVKQIAADLGFESEYYFYRLFKKMTTMAPHKYRRRGNQDAGKE